MLTRRALECVKSAHICKCGKLLCTKPDKSDLTSGLNWLWIGVAKLFKLLTLNTFIANKEKYTIYMGPQNFFELSPQLGHRANGFDQLTTLKHCDI